MTDVVKTLGVKDIERITAKVKLRQAKFNEDLMMSIGVVLMNYGETYVEVRCIKGEWNGVKGDLTPRTGVPLCPNGHPLLELTEAPKLALIREISSIGD